SATALGGSVFVLVIAVVVAVSAVTVVVVMVAVLTIALSLIAVVTMLVAVARNARGSTARVGVARCRRDHGAPLRRAPVRGAEFTFDLLVVWYAAGDEIERRSRGARIRIAGRRVD